MVEIKEIRKKLIESIETSGMKKADICRALGITSATMAQYKSGKAMPALDTLANLCRIIDVSPAYILCFDEDESGRRNGSIKNSFNNFTGNNGNISFK